VPHVQFWESNRLLAFAKAVLVDLAIALVLTFTRQPNGMTYENLECLAFFAPVLVRVSPVKTEQSMARGKKQKPEQIVSLQRQAEVAGC
jgi:hypothetical protein